MDDVWDAVAGKLEDHFSAAKACRHTITGRPISGFQALSNRPRHVVFIDGGNGSLFLAPSASVQLVRVAALEYDGTRRVATHRKEALCTITHEGSRIDVQWAGADWPAFSIEATDQSVETAADLARHVAERSFARPFTQLVVFDGDLEPRHDVERKVLDSLQMPHCALAKTTSLLTDQGNSIAGVLQASGPKEPWLYPLTTTAFVKLHPLSTRAYRFDVKGISHAEAAAALMATNDPSFPGYPYGLVEADILARVTMREQQALAELLRTRLGGRWQEHSGALDAHAVLDAIAGNVSAR